MFASSETTELQEQLQNEKVGHLTFVEQREITRDDPMVFGMDPPIQKLDPLSMPETEFTSQDILKNPVLIKTASWNAADPVLKEILALSIPGAAVNVKSFHQLMLKTYAFYRPQFKIRVQVNSTKFHQGRLACWYSPFNQHFSTPEKARKYQNLTAITGLPHSLIDAAQSNVVEFDIPFEHIQTALTTNSDDTLNEMGKYHITVFNQLKAASGSTTSLTINVFLSAALIKLHVPIHPHEPTVVFSPSPPLKAQGFIGDIVSKVAPTLDSGSGAIWNLISGNYSGAAKDAGKTMSGLSGILSSFNLDKPTNPLNATENMLTRPGPLAHCNGIDTSVRLGNSSMGGYLCHSEFSSTTEAEMKIDNLIKIPMFVKSIPWKSTDAVNSVLLTIPVTPSWCNATVGNFEGDMTNVFVTGKPVTHVKTTYYKMENTYLSYLSSMFVFWRGPIKFRFDVVSTQFHTGRLGMQFVPNHDKTVPSTWTLADRSQDPLTIFDIHEQKSVEVEVPYFSSTMSKIWAPLTTAYGSSGGQDFISDNNIIGYLHVYVQNALAAPSNVSPDVDVNVYISAGENFELDVLAPKPNIGTKPQSDIAIVGAPVLSQGQPLVRWPVEYYKPDKLKAQMESVPTRSGEPAQTTSLSKDNKALAPYNRFGDRLTDVREIGRRYVRSGYLWIKMRPQDDHSYFDATTGRPLQMPPKMAGSATIAVTPLNGLCGDREDLSSTSFNTSDLTYEDYQICSAGVARMYATWHGSMRYKLIPLDGRLGSGILEASYIPDWNAWTPIKSYYSRIQDEVDVGHYFNFSSYPTVATVNNQNAGLEVEVPYYSSYQQSVVEGNNGGKSRTFISGVLKVTYITTDYVAMKRALGDENYPCIGFAVYQALGDDFSFGFPVSPPTTYFNYLTEVGPKKVGLAETEMDESGAVTFTDTKV